MIGMWKSVPAVHALVTVRVQRHMGHMRIMSALYSRQLQQPADQLERLRLADRLVPAAAVSLHRIVDHFGFIRSAFRPAS